MDQVDNTQTHSINRSNNNKNWSFYASWFVVIGRTTYKVFLPKIKPESDLYSCVSEIFCTEMFVKNFGELTETLRGLEANSNAQPPQSCLSRRQCCHPDPRLLPSQHSSFCTRSSHALGPLWPPLLAALLLHLPGERELLTLLFCGTRFWDKVWCRTVEAGSHNCLHVRETGKANI